MSAQAPGTPMLASPSGKVATDEDLLVSYLTLRRVIGALGLAMPVILVLGGLGTGCECLQTSISAYYDVPHLRDVFVGSLCAIGFFLFTYRGYEALDDHLGYICWALALGVALIPHDSRFSVVHYASAAGLFLVLAYYSFFLFTKTDGQVTSEKVTRNRVYRICGAVMVGCLAAILIHTVYAYFRGLPTAGWPGVLWLEWAILWAFGFAWMVKGKTLLQDAGLPPRQQPADFR